MLGRKLIGPTGRSFSASEDLGRTKLPLPAQTAPATAVLKLLHPRKHNVRDKTNQQMKSVATLKYRT